jgi:hypothetical protein
MFCVFFDLCVREKRWGNYKEAAHNQGGVNSPRILFPIIRLQIIKPISSLLEIN